MACRPTSVISASSYLHINYLAGVSRSYAHFGDTNNLGPLIVHRCINLLMHVKHYTWWKSTGHEKVICNMDSLCEKYFYSKYCLCVAFTPTECLCCKYTWCKVCTKVRNFHPLYISKLNPLPTNDVYMCHEFPWAQKDFIRVFNTRL